jgi:anti-sigma factor (TIGR02949 family)
MNRINSGDCNKVFQHICENLDHELDSPECAAVRAHLESCPDCQEHLQKMKEIIRLYQQYPVPEPDQGFRTKLFDILHIEPDSEDAAARQLPDSHDL